MDITKYTIGKGIDVSRKRNLEGVPSYFQEPNNFYSLKEYLKYESADFIYSNGLINETKFFRILIKEWMNFCKVGGHIIIEMVPNELLSFEELVSESQIVAGEKGKVVEKKQEDEKATLVIKKIRPILEKGDSSDKWSFGIITGGVTDDNVDKSVKSILDLNIPQFEIIVCGIYKGRYRKNKKVKILEFDVPIPWITKKKNMICESAKYENLVIIHDHFSLKKNWYEGMKKYGNYFEVLSNVVQDKFGRRAQDWVTYGIPLRPFSKYAFTGAGGNLEYADWDKNIDIGGFCVIKKSVWKKCPWDERLLLWQAEDMKISGDFYYSGIVPRFNQHSEAETVKTNWGDYNILYKFDKYRLGKPTSSSPKTLIRYYIKNLIYKKFGVYLKRPDAHNEMQRTFAVPMRK